MLFVQNLYDRFSWTRPTVFLVDVIFGSVGKGPRGGKWVRNGNVTLGRWAEREKVAAKRGNAGSKRRGGHESHIPRARAWTVRARRNTVNNQTGTGTSRECLSIDNSDNRRREVTDKRNDFEACRGGWGGGSDLLNNERKNKYIINTFHLSYNHQIRLWLVSAK